MPRRIADGIRRIIAVQGRLAHGRLGRFARTDVLEPALETLEIDLEARGEDTSVVAGLRREAAESGLDRNFLRSSSHRRGGRIPRRG
jgi:poly(A) polymerase